MADPFQTCLQQIIQKAGEGGERKATSSALLGGVYDYWRAELRVEAIRRGMEYIYVLSRDSSVFNTFGNDIIQCFYDLSRVTPEPIRHLTLEYLNVVKKKWLSTLQCGYWKERDIPNEQEVLDAAIILYSLQCLNSDVHFGSELQEHVIAGDTTETRGKLGVSELFGWNPRKEGIPSNIVDLCVKCHRRSPRRSAVCKYCGTEVVVITPYRALSNSLIYSFYCTMAGIELECSYDDFLKWLPTLRPYKMANEIPWKEFVDQCYLITHVIFTISQWGQLRLQVQQLPHEYLFLLEHLPLVIEKRDIHLVGEFIQCLRIFGVEENHITLRDGLQFLLEEQRDDGSWDNQMQEGEFDTDLAYVAYHATMVAIQALIPPLFTGFGCMSESTEEIVSEWYSTEFLKNKCIPAPISAGEIANDFMLDPRLAMMEDSLDQIFDRIPSILAIQKEKSKMRR